MVTAMAAAMMAKMVAVVATKTTVATAMAGGTDNNQLQVAAEETGVVAKETAMATERATRRHS